MTSEKYVVGIVGAGIVVALLLIPAFSSPWDNQIIDNTHTTIVSSGSNETTVCSNAGSGTILVKDSTSGNCTIRTIVGSGDISITNSSNSVIIDFNGTIASSESTVCYNVGTGYLIVKNSTSGNCYLKSLVAGTGITVSNGTNTITVTNSNGESTSCSSTSSTGTSVCESSGNVLLKRILTGTGISIANNSTHITITNSLPEATTCSNLGTGAGGYGIYKTGNCTFKSILPSTGISMTNNTNDITITNSGVITNSCSAPITCSGTSPSSITCATCSTNSAQETTVCSNIGSGTWIVRNSTSGNCNVKTLAVSTGISISNSTTLITFTNTGVTSNVAGTGISVSGATGAVTVTNTGVISNSCSSGISCSGTNPSAFTNSGVTSNVAGTGISVSGATGAVTVTNTGVISGSCTTPIVCSATNPLAISCPTCGVSSGGLTQIVDASLTADGTLNQVTGTATVLHCSDLANINCAEKITASSALVGKIVNTMSGYLIKNGSPTGTCTVGVFDSTDTLLFTFGTQDLSSLTTSAVQHVYTNYASSRTIASGDYIGMKCPANTNVNFASIEASTVAGGTNYDTTNSIVSQYSSGAWVDASTWDLGAASNGWALAYVQEVSFTAYKNYLVYINPLNSGSTSTLAIMFNEDTGTTYSQRHSNNGGADGTTVSSTGCAPMSITTLASTDSAQITMFISDVSASKRKMADIQTAYGGDTSSATAPARYETICKWDNTANQITSIQISATGLTPFTTSVSNTGSPLYAGHIDVYGWN